MKEGDIMNIDKLINEMNSHNKKSKKKKGVKKYIDDIKRYIYEVIYYINGITRSERIILTNNISKDFVRKSKLDWFEKKSIESDEFRYRFLTILLLNLVKTVDVISFHTYVTKNVGRSKKNMIKRIDHMDNINDIISSFIEDIINRENHMISAVRLNQIINYTNSKKDPHKLNEDIRIGVFTTKNYMGVPSIFSTDEFMPDDLGINYITKLGYLLTTCNKNYKGLLKFKSIKYITLDDDMTPIIENLGKCVLNTPYAKRSPMFNAFIEAKPLIPVKQEIENPKLSMGCLVLKYVEFFCDLENINDFIDEVLNVYIK